MSKNLDLIYVNDYPLDNIQKNVVYSDNKYTIVIAGAGSGKSTTIVGKIKYLVYTKNIDPQDIVAISFTNESTKSLENTLINNRVTGVTVTTFHKLALKFIKKERIINEDYLSYIINEYLLSNYYTYKKIIIEKAFKTDYSLILKSINKYIKQLTRIICLCHTNNYKLEDFNKARIKILKKIFFKRANLLSLLYITIDIYYIYQEEKESYNAVDFDDMIIKATNNIKKYHLSYKYIIVDEYQDTSTIRVRFLQELIKYSNAKLMVVGDDYQSIYRFNGCDLNIFLNFKKYFPDAKVFKLQNTYRNSQELINISKRFILKNPFQIKKKLKSNKHLYKPIRIVYYTDKNIKKRFNKLINYIDKNIGNYLILGRNNFDLKRYTDKDLNYMTVHKSKGLEADNIVIINLEKNLYGFPNMIKDIPIEKVLFNNIINYQYDEERRLFYVALTRTKNYVFLFVNKNNPSIFIKEIKKIMKS